MRAAAARLVGRHDFRAFRSADDEREVTVRTIRSIEVIEGHGADPRLVAIEVIGDAFMKNMVRIIAGTLVAVGRGRMTAAQVAALLQASALRHKHSETAPAHGLTLVHVTLGRRHPTVPPADR